MRKRDIADAFCCAIQVHFLRKKFQVYPTIKFLNTASRCGRDSEVEREASIGRKLLHILILLRYMFRQPSSGKRLRNKNFNVK